jgi:hypothetical protein
VRLRDAAPALFAYVTVRLAGLAVLAVWAAAAGRDAHHLLVSWDGQWYRGIARGGYGFVRLHEDGRSLSDFAFFPLYPGLERVVGTLAGIRYVDAGLVVSAIASLLAAWGIYAVGNHLYGHRVGIVLVVLWAALPIGIVQSMAYSESLFTALAAWSLYAAITGHWLWAGLAASLAGLTRPVGVAVVAAVMVAAAIELGRGRSVDRGLPVLVGAALAPLGWLGYVGWVGVETGDPLGYFVVAERWGNDFDGGAAFAGWIWDFLSGPDVLVGLLLCAALAVLVWLFVLCIRQRQPLPLLVYTGVLLFLALTTSGYFGSKPRYLLPAFPLLAPIAVAVSGLRPRVTVGVLTLLAAGSAVYGAFWLHGPGPP